MYPAINLVLLHVKTKNPKCIFQCESKVPCTGRMEIPLLSNSIGARGLTTLVLSSDKLALLWGEAQKKIAYCYPNMNYSGLKVTYVNPR